MPPKPTLWGRKRVIKQLIALIGRLEASQGGTDQQGHQEAQQEGPKVQRVDRCPTGKAPKGPQSEPQGLPRGALGVSSILQKILFILVFGASQGGTKQEDHEKERQEAPTGV